MQNAKITNDTTFNKVVDYVQCQVDMCDQLPLNIQINTIKMSKGVYGNLRNILKSIKVSPSQTTLYV